MFAARTSLILALCVSCYSSRSFGASEPVEDLLAATYRLDDGEHSGTCFLVKETAAECPRPKQAILVTAKHVLEQMIGDECELILRSKSEDGDYVRRGVSIAIRRERNRLWTQHPDVDVAALRIELPDDVETTLISVDQIAGEDQLIDRTVRVGQETWIACYPAKLEANHAGWPILRKGSIASHPLIPLKETRTLLVDYSVFGGDSGAPVAVIVKDRLMIVGLASSMQRQTDRTSIPFEDRVVHTPLALSIVVQAPFLRETIGFLRPQ